ncbi:Hsp20/alpha crystallin family protein [Bdellovibrio sp. 22V]|uniref:Hsp20/alpha crystallin family protein n=1 Tax=Bdellovibrio TaxID=958 RepID=UPI0025433EEF|nr:Hsp20/alpha crystallin family protein [Bdellovibrio sp. 22V]WII72592.1 Hsp20/alpha crystallin family protein [Bdellovibrio sp. 22V]
MRLLTPYLANRRDFSNDIFSEMERFFEDFAGFPRVNVAQDGNTYTPAIDVTEADEHYLMSVDLPGMKKEDIKIEMDGNMLTISGERKRETKSVSFSRRFTIPTTVDAEKIEAHYEDGVLNLYLPKTPVAKARKIEVQTDKGGFFDRLLTSKKDVENASEKTAH